MAKYIPGQLIREFTDQIKPSEATRVALEYGFYDGDYEVVRNPSTPLPQDLEAVRVAAAALWPNRLVSLEEIIAWVEDGAVDPQSKAKAYQVVPGGEREGAALLIDNGLFKRHW